MSVLKYMLLTFQHSHEAFHLVRAHPCCVPHWSGWKPDKLSLVKGSGLEAQAFEALDVRTR